MPWHKKRVYLDVAAGVVGNSSSPHEEGRATKAVLEEARRDIARLVEVQADDVIFTSGATESNAIAILGIPRALRARGASNIHALYLSTAHASIVENMKVLESEGVAIEALPIRESRVDTEALRAMLRPETVLVAMEAVCGETGVVWNTRAVAEVLQKYKIGHDMSDLGGHLVSTRLRVFLHVDASQASLTEKISREHFGADTLTLDGAKVGPRGIGLLVAHRTIPMAPLYAGGGQERGVRPGSEAPELAREFAAALHAATDGAPAFRAAAERRRVELVTNLTAIPGLVINEGRTQAPNILNLSLLGRDTDYLVALLDEAGFALATRSACETDSMTGSRAVEALMGDAARARATLRVSWGSATRPRDLTDFAKALSRAVAFIDSANKR